MTLWKEIPWSNGAYSVSDEGEVRSNDRIGINGRKYKGRILKPRKNNSGYLCVQLQIDGKSEGWLIHRLVAKVFFNTFYDDLPIDHIDCNKENNHLNNLEFVTQKENVRRARENGHTPSSEKLKQAQKSFGKRMTEQNKKFRKPILQFSKDNEFIARYDFALDACKKNNWSSPSNLGRCANGKLKSAYGYIWKWENQSEKCND